jgi:hypothetical protein
VVAALARLLREHPDAKVRQDAARGLGVTRSHTGEAALLEAIATDTAAQVIDNANQSLGPIREEHTGS